MDIMRLYFTCPKEKKTFDSSDYFLGEGYKIVVSDSGEKKLEGIVSLRSRCPFCGKFHTYKAEEVICPYG